MMKCRFLGLCVESSLGWLTHVNHVSNKLSTGIYMLRMLRASFVYAHIHSHTSYGLLFMVWPVLQSLNCRKEQLELSAATLRELTVDHFLLNIEY
ncbi:hypothetical protein C0J52_20456 [Blattella germanica]|nr:hypothetical protein C0J52_20456 [Blattella germanica]